MENLERIIAEHPFFKGLDKKYLELLVGCAKNVRFDANQYLFESGQEANYFYLIRAGKVGLELSAPELQAYTIQTVGEDEVLGWSWLVEPYYWMFDAKAVNLVRAIALDGKCLRKKCEEDHDLGYEFFKRFSGVISQRLRVTMMQLVDVLGHKS